MTRNVVSTNAPEMGDAHVPVGQASGKPVCASETAWPGVTSETCSLEAPPRDASPVDLENVNLALRIGGARVLVFHSVADAAACADLQAWHYDDASNPTRIVLCPQACSLFASDPDSQLEIVVGCLKVR